MKNVLVAIPYKAGLNQTLKAKMFELSDRLQEANSDYKITLARMENSISPDGIPFSPHAQSRNMLIKKHLKEEHDLVMWLDADLVSYPADIITQLDKANPGGVTAPIVLIEGTDIFYDTYGFRQRGQQLSAKPPYFTPIYELTELDAVGCAYLIPAKIYRLYKGKYKYRPIAGQTEHYSIMQDAKMRGMKVACFTGMTIYHANLAKYGESWHGH